MPSCANPRPKMSFFIDQRWDSLSSRPTMKSSRTTPSSATVPMVSRVPDEAQAGWPDDDPGREVAEDGAQPAA